jgi:mannose-6-phosphate isomerase
VTPEEFREAIETDTCKKVVRLIDCDAGDFHFLPAGTVHAIGAGLVIAEVQTPSDTTYRVTDWGRGREIHVERSMQCIRFDLTRDNLPGAQGDTLLVTDYFTVAQKKGEGMDRPMATPAGRCTALMFLGGGGLSQIRHSGAVESCVSIHPGDTVLLPAALRDVTVSAPKDAEYLVITLPES